MLLITKHSFKEQRNTLSTITGNVKGTQIIIYTAQRTDPRHFSIFEPCRAFCLLAKKMMADGFSPSAIQAEAKSKEVQVNRLIASIQANVRVSTVVSPHVRKS